MQEIRDCVAKLTSFDALDAQHEEVVTGKSCGSKKVWNPDKGSWWENKGSSAASSWHNTDWKAPSHQEKSAGNSAVDDAGKLGPLHLFALNACFPVVEQFHFIFFVEKWLAISF